MTIPPLTPSGKQNNTVIVSLIGLIGIVLVGLMGLVALGKDLNNVIYFMGPTVLTLVGIVTTLVKVNQISGQASAAVVQANTNQATLNNQNATLSTIADAVNGALTAKHDTLNQKLDAISTVVIPETIAPVVNKLDAIASVVAPTAVTPPPVTHNNMGDQSGLPAGMSPPA